jgi:hypothetical protein
VGRGGTSMYSGGSNGSEDRAGSLADVAHAPCSKRGELSFPLAFVHLTYLESVN